MNQESKQVDVNVLIEALEMQRNQAMSQSAMAVARSVQLEKENGLLRAELETLKAAKTKK